MPDPRSSSSKRLGASAAEATSEARFEAALRDADDLLLGSLQNDERRRTRRKKSFLFLALGGLTMLAILSCLLLALMFWAPASTAGADQSHKLTQQGWQLWQTQNPDEARAKFQQAVELAPKNTSAWNGLGWCNFNTGRPEDAAQAFERVIALEPKHPAALNGLGQLALAKRDYAAAEKYLLKAAPAAPAAWYGLAKLYLLQGQYTQAEKWAKKAVASGEADDSARRMLAAAQAKELPQDLRNLIEPPPASLNNGEFMQAWQLFNRGRNAEAREIFERLLAGSPNDPNILNGLGWALLNSGLPEQAKPHFEKAAKLQPDAGGVLNGLARVYKAEGKTDEAVKIWKHMLEVSPGPNAGTYGLIETYLEQENYKEALPLLEQLVKSSPQDKRLQAKLALAKERAAP